MLFSKFLQTFLELMFPSPIALSFNKPNTSMFFKNCHLNFVKIAELQFEFQSNAICSPILTLWSSSVSKRPFGPLSIKLMPGKQKNNFSFPTAESTYICIIFQEHTHRAPPFIHRPCPMELLLAKVCNIRKLMIFKLEFRCYSRGDSVKLAEEKFKHVILRTQWILSSNVMGALGGSDDIISYNTHHLWSACIIPKMHMMGVTKSGLKNQFREKIILILVIKVFNLEKS